MTREELVKLAKQYGRSDLIRRIFLDEPSSPHIGKREIEHEVKKKIANFYDVPFRSIALCGSAQLGFSPYKNTTFKPGRSDLDVAIIDAKVFQTTWMKLVGATRAFNDLSSFRGHANPTEIADQVKSMMLKRGLFHLHQLPICKEFEDARRLIDSLSTEYRTMFSEVSLTIYMNEYAFCWKQDSAIQGMLP